MESVLLLTFPQAVFSERPDIYFKIAEQIRFEEYIRLAKSAVRLLIVKQKTALSVAVETDESIDSVLLYEQLSKNLVLNPDRNQSFEPPDLRHCVVKISRLCHRIAVKILPSTGTNHATHNSNFCLDGALVY